MVAYLVLGFTLNVSFDVTEFNNRLTAVWGRE